MSVLGLGYSLLSLSYSILADRACHFDRYKFVLKWNNVTIVTVSGQDGDLTVILTAAFLRHFFKRRISLCSYKIQALKNWTEYVNYKSGCYSNEEIYKTRTDL